MFERCDDSVPLLFTLVAMILPAPQPSSAHKKKAIPLKSSLSRIFITCQVLVGFLIEPLLSSLNEGNLLRVRLTSHLLLS
jgi:hypothetical protein